MGTDDERIGSDRDDQGRKDFVPAVFAKSLEEGEVYCELLNEHDIPTILSDGGNGDGASGRSGRRSGITHGVMVLVPEMLLDEAGMVIAVQEELGEVDLAAADEDDESHLDEDDWLVDEDDEDFDR